jgi:Pyridoxamine 5'-phosphate oxidase
MDRADAPAARRADGAVTAIPGAIASVLDRGAFCHVAARTERGPHLTPAVFAFSNERVWVTTSRGSVKARAWRSDPTVAGLVRDGDDAVAFAGRVRTYDLLDAGTWPDALARSPAVALASFRFSRKNARFFAGYAIDARHVPLSWTPPGRVFVELEIASAALIRRGEAVERTSGVDPDAWPEPPASRAGYRRSGTADALGALPERLRTALGREGDGALCLDGGLRPTVLPARWCSDDGALLAAVPTDALALSAPGPSSPAALALDRPSWWRARRMLGCMVQGTADVFVPSQVRTGRAALAAAIARAGGDAERTSLVRLRPRRVVWWEGWSSGSTTVA